MPEYKITIQTEERWEEVYFIRGKDKAEIEARVPLLYCGNRELDERYELERRVVSYSIKRERNSDNQKG